MIPNKNEKNKILFKCNCGGNHFLEVSFDKEWDKELWISFIDYPNSFWETLKWWWHQRKLWQSEIEISKEEVRDLVEVLNKYLKEDN